MAGVIETLANLGAFGTGIGAAGSFVTGIIGGILQNKQAEKAQAYQEKWAEKLYENQLAQQAIQNEQAQEQLNLNKAAQYFNNELAKRTEARQNTADWHTYMQNAANKYADVLNKSRALRKSNAAALRNR